MDDDRSFFTLMSEIGSQIDSPHEPDIIRSRRVIDMTRFSDEAIKTALQQLSKSARVKRTSNWIAAFLTGSRMTAAGYDFSAVGANDAVADLFVLVPDIPNGRINPFINLSSKVRWLKNSESGRTTIWNNATRGNPQSALFVDAHIQNGMRDDALELLLAELKDEGTLPARDALAVLIGRNHDWSDEPSRVEVVEVAATHLGLSPGGFELLTEDEPLGVPFLAGSEWSADLLKEWEYGPSEVDPAATIVAGDLKPEASAAEVAELAELFQDFLTDYGIAAEAADVRDLLAATLSSQLIIMAGPSGSGKSLMATALAAFFAPRDRRARLEASRFLARQEEFLGYYSHLAGEQFVAQTPLLDLIPLAGGEEFGTPVVVIEEANLSPIEGYLSTLIHGLGGNESLEVAFRLHAKSAPLESQSDETLIPPRLVLSPYPRFFATINVDADSPAPARKVASRACVVLMETPTVDGAMASAEILVQPSLDVADGPASHLLARPSVAFVRYADSASDAYQQALALRAGDLRSIIGSDVVSPRAWQKCLFYIAWYIELGGELPPGSLTRDVAVAVDNALLHFVFPTLTAHQFGAVIERLAHIEESSIVSGRIDRLRSAISAQQFGPSPDFWGALS